MVLNLKIDLEIAWKFQFNDDNFYFGMNIL